MIPIKKVTTKRKFKNNIASGVVHILSSFNNTIVSITDEKGRLIFWLSASSLEFEEYRKNIQFAANEYGLKTVLVYVKGPGTGREIAIRAIQTAGIEIIGIKDLTPIPHNACGRPLIKESIYCDNTEKLN